MRKKYSNNQRLDSNILNGMVQITNQGSYDYIDQENNNEYHILLDQKIQDYISNPSSIKKDFFQNLFENKIHIQSKKEIEFKECLFTSQVIIFTESTKVKFINCKFSADILVFKENSESSSLQLEISDSIVHGTIKINKASLNSIKIKKSLLHNRMIVDESLLSKVEIHDSHLYSGIEIIETQIENTIDLGRSTIYKRNKVHFSLSLDKSREQKLYQKISKEKRGSLEYTPLINLEYTNIIDTLLLVKANMSGAKLLFSDISRIEFINCKWDKKVLWHEYKKALENTKKEDLDELQRITSHIRMYYEGGKDYRLSELFFEREIDIKIKRNDLWRKFTLIVYKRVFGYGNSFVKPFLGLILVIVISFLVYNQILKESPDLLNDCNDLTYLRRLVKNFPLLIDYTLHISFFQKNIPVNYSNWFITTVNALQQAFTIGFLSGIIIAVRKIFRK